MKNAITVAVLLGLLAVAGWFGLDIWTDIGDVEMSNAGAAAMTGGIVVSLLVGGGLMFLVFWSSRHGHDDFDRRDR